LNVGFWWGNLREREHFENLDVDEWIILKRLSINGIGELH